MRLKLGERAVIRWTPRILIHGRLAARSQISITPEAQEVNHPASGAGGLCIGMAAAPHDSVSQHSASVNYSIGSAQAVGWRRRRQTSRQVSVAGLPVTTCLPGRHERSCSVLSGEWLLSLFSQESWSQSVRARDNKHSDPPTPSNPSSQVIAQATEPACNAALHFTASLMFAPAGVDAS